MSSLLSLVLIVLSSYINVCNCKGNNAGKDQYNGTTTAWNNISLITSKAKWTHFVYVLADNNLDWYATTDLDEMRTNNAKPDELNLVIYVDRCHGCDGSNYMANVSDIYDCDTMNPISGIFNGSKLLQKQNNIWCQLYDFGHEIDSLLQNNIIGFIGLMQQYQLTSTFFILEFWNHGGAWVGYGSDDNTANGNRDNEIENLEKLFIAIEEGLQETHLGRLDILGFDACIMADYSVLHYLSEYNVAKYYIASEVSEPGVGWDYYNGLNAKENTTLIGYAISIIDAYVSQGDVQSADAGAGYTLALFDMDNTIAFLNELDTLIRIMTLGIESYDYGMIMSVLRGETSTVSVEAEFLIYDFGLFIDGLVSKQNIYFQSCNERMQFIAENVVSLWQDSIVYFKADFVRKDLTGASIFISSNESDISLYSSYNQDLSSENYVEFLEAMSDVLLDLGSDDDAVSLLETNITCSASIPDNITFSLSDHIGISYADKEHMYLIEAKVSPTVASAETSIWFDWGNTSSNGTDLYWQVVSLETDIIDYDYDSALLASYWDGNIPFWFDSNNYSNYIWSSGIITHSQDVDSIGSVPDGLIARYPVYVYDMNSDSNDSNDGYLEFNIITGNGSTIDTPKLYEIDSYYQVISEVSKSDSKILRGKAIVSNGNKRMNYQFGKVYWPNIEAQSWNFLNSQPIISVIAKDVFGNIEYSMNLFNNQSNVSVWTPIYNDTYSTSTEMPITSTDISTASTEMNETLTMSTDSTMMSTTSTQDNTNDNENKHNTNETGLDSVNGLIWLILIIVLFVILLVFIYLYVRAKSQAGLIVDAFETNTYVQMTD